MTRPIRWNFDKPHRCPDCHAVAIDMERPKSRRIYTCCRCATRFTRWPRLSRLLPNAGVMCSEHRPKETPMFEPTTKSGPHPWAPKGWRYWICRHCYAPKSLHPRTGWVRARPLHDNHCLNARAPHFNEGW